MVADALVVVRAFACTGPQRYGGLAGGAGPPERGWPPFSSP